MACSVLLVIAGWIEVQRHGVLWKSSTIFQQASCSWFLSKNLVSPKPPLFDPWPFRCWCSWFRYKLGPLAHRHCNDSSIVVGCVFWGGTSGHPKLASGDVWIILDLRDFLFTCLVQNQVERAALDGFPRLGAGIEFPGVWKTYETLQGGGSLDIGLATENHGKITWEKVDTIGKHVRNLVGFAILFGTIDGFIWFRTWKPQLSPHVQAKSFPFSSQYPSLVCSKLTF